MLKPRYNIAGNYRCLKVAVVFSTLFFASIAAAAPIDEHVGYKLSICESLEVLKHPSDMNAAMMAAWTTPAELAQARSQPYLKIKNTSDNSELKDFYMTIGNTDNHFDWAKVISLPGGVSAKIVGLDSKNGGKTSELLQIQFSGFKPGQTAYFQINIDPDANMMQYGDYRMVLFGTGATDPSEHRARFVNSSLPTPYEKFLTGYESWDEFHPDYPTNIGLEPRAAYGMDHVQPFDSGNSGSQPVPEPSAFALAGIAIAALAFGYRRRGNAA